MQRRVLKPSLYYTKAKTVATSATPSGSSGKEGELSAHLLRWSQGDASALEELAPLVFDDLRQIALHHLRGEASDSLTSTLVVNEVFLKILGWRRVRWTCRQEFFAFASRLARRILVDLARHRRAAKRDGGTRVPLEQAASILGWDADRELEVLMVNDCLGRLRKRHERAARLVELRYFGGFTLEEAADTLGWSPATLKKDWCFARRWLARELTDGKRA